MTRSSRLKERLDESQEPPDNGLAGAQQLSNSSFDLLLIVWSCNSLALMSRGYTAVERRAKGQSQSLAYGRELAHSTCIRVAINYAGVQLHGSVQWGLTCAFIISAEEIQLFPLQLRCRDRSERKNFVCYYLNYIHVFFPLTLRHSGILNFTLQLSSLTSSAI